jgi:hypothetical protein
VASVHDVFCLFFVLFFVYGLSLEDMDPALPFSRYAATRPFPSQWRSPQRCFASIAGCTRSRHAAQCPRPSPRLRKGAVLVDLTIGLGIPFIQMSLRAFSLHSTLV